MGSNGSIHFFSTDEALIEGLITAYSAPSSMLNADASHNGRGTPMIIKSERFISVYDGSFAVYGDMYAEAALLSSAVGKPAMCLTNGNDEVIGIFAQDGNKIVTEGLFIDGEWHYDLDAALFLDKIALPYEKEEFAVLLETDDSSALVESFQAMTGLAFVWSEVDIYCLDKERSAGNVDIYKQIRPFDF